jgi:hypothetical protein
LIHFAGQKSARWQGRGSRNSQRAKEKGEPAVSRNRPFLGRRNGTVSDRHRQERGGHSAFSSGESRACFFPTNVQISSTSTCRRVRPRSWASMNRLHRWPNVTIRRMIVSRWTPDSRAVDRIVFPSTRWCKTSICFSRGSTLHIADSLSLGLPLEWRCMVASGESRL